MGNEVPLGAEGSNVATFLVALSITMLSLKLLLPVLRRLDLVDIPNERSSHLRPVCRGGGLAIAVGTSAALVASGTAGGVMATTLLVVSAGFATLGLADDFESRSVALRLATQLVLALAAAFPLAFVVDLRPMIFAIVVVGVAAWVVTFVNIFNFMDGINGISAATASIAGVVYVTLGIQLDSGLLTSAAAALLGGAAGFLPFNFPVARVFAGDVGSYFLGSYIAIVAVIAMMEGASVVTVAAPLFVYLVDTTTTLVRRAVAGKRVFKSHREHSYQHLANGRLTHTSTTALVAFITSASAGIGLLAHGRSAAAAMACLLAIICLAGIFVSLPNVLPDRRAVAQGVR